MCTNFMPPIVLLYDNIDSIPNVSLLTSMEQSDIVAALLLSLELYEFIDDQLVINELVGRH